MRKNIRRVPTARIGDQGVPHNGKSGKEIEEFERTAPAHFDLFPTIEKRPAAAG
jgi:hypothetical protein